MEIGIATIDQRGTTRLWPREPGRWVTGELSPSHTPRLGTKPQEEAQTQGQLTWEAPKVGLRLPRLCDKVPFEDLEGVNAALQTITLKHNRQTNELIYSTAARNARNKRDIDSVICTTRLYSNTLECHSCRQMVSKKGKMISTKQVKLLEGYDA